ncbi:UPF0324 membrane protein Cgl0015/cg0018 [Arthrobacter sp. Hiyo8]|nr:UPF0324 membrane protein Cgl0015/cg0018 [Arthrobacter sp. Hiyo8]
MGCRTRPPGLDFAGKHHMRAGIVLLGLKVSVVDVLDLGWFALVLIAAVVLLSFAGTYGLARLVKLPREGALLIATGFSICGASAIGAMAAVRRIKHQDTVLPVALVTLCGTLAIGVLPLLMHPLGLSPEQFGAWTGASVHDVGQVVATAQTAGPVALALAVVVKLTRVVLLAPIVAGRALRNDGPCGGSRATVRKRTTTAVSFRRSSLSSCSGSSRWWPSVPLAGWVLACWTPQEGSRTSCSPRPCSGWVRRSASARCCTRVAAPR